ncbi:MAG: bifunctional 4'-phosphopantothenoylcysteine decarboxylase/phosphopantothenoylcysteine synthetase, partial [Burkholderiales bacterium]|nr:bifunctional 4'-phosphopantothenoylcysteine decarboxylase/phosphopantothenoylcysteine synthetase [Burkholderiales bacterium]
GAAVTLVSGPTGLEPPADVALLRVVTAQEMHDAVMQLVPQTDILIAVAAVADYRVSDQ